MKGIFDCRFLIFDWGGGGVGVEEEPVGFGRGCAQLVDFAVGGGDEEGLELFFFRGVVFEGEESLKIVQIGR